jgi:hypothetical protein
MRERNKLSNFVLHDTIFHLFFDFDAFLLPVSRRWMRKNLPDDSRLTTGQKKKKEKKQLPSIQISYLGIK